MAADFMAHPALFRSSLLLLLCLFTVRCNGPGYQPVTIPMINRTTGNFRMADDTLFRDNHPYSGYVYALYENSKDTAEILCYRQGKEDGVWKRLYENGSLKEIRAFSNGRKTGEYMAWWENGHLKLRYQFTDDEYDGICREWNEEGRLIKEMTYTKGYEAGPQKMYYDNGKIRANYVVTNGRRYGLLGSKKCINVSDSVFKK